MRIREIFAMYVCWIVILLPISMSISISGVNSEVINDKEVRINWTTSEPSTGKVMFGEAAPTRTATAGTQSSTNHSVLLSVLGGTSYVYEIVAKNESSGEETTDNNGGNHYTFETPQTVTISHIDKKIIAETTDDKIKYEINWTTDILTDQNFVLYGTSQNNLSETVQGPTSAEIHNIQLNLDKGKTYYYSVKSNYLQVSGGRIIVPTDITPPEITIEKFDDATKQIINSGFTSNATMKLKGTIEPNISISVYMNNMKRKTIETRDTGNFDEEINLINGLNRFDLEASDLSGNKAHYYFNITSDSTPPQIILIPIDETTIKDKVWVNGSLSENASVKITNNGQEILNQQNILDFSVEATLAAQNNITIEATDLSGNKANITRTTGMLPPPTIRMVYPRETPGQDAITFTTSVWRITLEGTTTPNTTLQIYTYAEGLGKPEKALFNVTSDSQGNFKKPIWVYTCETDFAALFDGKDPTSYGGGTHSEINSSLSCGNSTTTKILIQPIDMYGREGKNRTITANYKRCGSGNDDWTAYFKPDPHAFKPYRLKDGTEILNVELQLAWKGMTDSYKIDSLRIERQQDYEDFKHDKDYECIINGSVFSFGLSPISSASNANGTYWYFMYKLNAWKGLNTSKVDQWNELFKSLANGKCIIPLKVRINYHYADIWNGTQVTGMQEICTKTENMIQPQIDPNLIIPEWLLDDSINMLNVTTHALDDIAPIVQTTNNVLLGLCGVYLLGYGAKHTTTYLKCFNDAAKLENPTDPMPAECTKAIQEERSTYNHFRAICDRVLCKSVPVNPAAKGETKLSTDAEIQETLKPKNDKCLPANNYYCASGFDDPAFKSNCDMSYKQGVEQKNVDASSITWSTSDCKFGDSDTKKNICCLRNTYDKTKILNVEAVKADNKILWGTEGAKKATGTGWNTEWFVNVPWNYGMWAGYGGEGTDKPLTKEQFMQGLSTAAAIKANISQAAKTANTLYYIDGYHATSCFGAGPSGFSSKKALREPSGNFIDAVRCGCVSQVNGYVQQYSGLLKQMQSCLEQVKAGADMNAGACKEVFSMFVCDLFTWVVVELVWEKGLNSFKTVPQVKNDKDALEVAKAGLAGGISGAAQTFKDDYGDSFRGKFDLGANSLAHAVCMGAFFHDWDPNLLSAIGADSAGPPRQSDAIISTAERQLLGQNPINGLASFEYRMGVWFSAGSNLRLLKISLVCDAEEDCPAVEEPLPFITLDRTFAGTETNAELIKKNAVLTPGGSMYVNIKDHRYNKIRVCWTSADGTEFSGCEEKSIKESGGVAFGCAVQPTAAPSGNNVFKCGILTMDDYAKFELKPLDTTFRITEDQQKLKIPFYIDAHYGTRDPLNQPYLLKQERKGVTKPQTTIQKIQEGRSNEINYAQFTVGRDDFAGAEQKVEVTSGCPSDIISGTTPTGTSQVVIKWGNDSNTFDETDSTKFIGTAQNKQYDKQIGSLTFTLNGLTFRMQFVKDKECSVTTKVPSPTGASNQVQVEFEIGIYEPHPANPEDTGATVWANREEQKYPIKVTLINDIERNTPTLGNLIIEVRNGTNILTKNNTDLLIGDTLSITIDTGNTNVLKSVITQIMLEGTTGTSIPASPNTKQYTKQIPLTASMKGKNSIIFVVEDDKGNKLQVTYTITVKEETVTDVSGEQR